MKKIIFTLITLFTIHFGWGQTVIAFNGAEDLGTTWSTSTNQYFASTTNTGTPSSGRIKNGSKSYQKANSTKQLITNSVATSGYTNCFVEIWNAGISKTSGNGMDSSDYLKVWVSETSTFGTTPDIQITGNSNVRYAMGGTGDLTTTAGTALSYTYPSGGTRTGTNAKSKLIINIPNSWSTVYLKIETKSNSSNEVWCIDDIALKGTVSGPTITTTPASLTGFSYVEGAGSSTEQSFDVTGSSLTADITVTPPTNWEIATVSGGPYQTTALTATQSGGNVNQTIYTRMVSGLLNANSPFSGNMVCASTGATTVNVAVDGTVTLACSTPTNQATALVFSNITASSIDVAFTAASPAADNYLVVRHTTAALSSDPVDATVYAVSDALGGGTVVFNGNTTSFTDSSLSSSTTYYYFVFAYNDSACSGGPKYLTPALTGNSTTLNGPCFDEDFEGNGNSFPSGWANNGSYINNSTPYHSSTHKLGMNSTNDWIRTTSLTDPNNLTFWGRASGSGSNFTIEVQSSSSTGGPWSTVSTISADGSNSGSVINSFQQYSVALGLSGTQYIRWYTTSRSGGSFYLDDVQFFCSAASSEIEIQGNSTEIVSGDTTPDIADDTDFGATTVVGGTIVKTYTIMNTGGADLIISGATSSNASEFTISGITLPTTITAGNSTTFTLTFDPSALGTRTATITVTNDDADESSYTFDVQGEGTNSNNSDIIANTGFTYTSNIDYTAYQGAGPFTDDTDNIAVFKFDIRDGGGSTDADALGTELTDITFSLGASHISYIRSAGLFVGSSPASTAYSIDTGAGTITFSALTGVNFTAPDNGTISLTLRISFNTTVTDNEQLQFTITSASANTSSSVFGVPNAGGASSSITGDRNRLEVTASNLMFNQQTSNALTNQAMSPSVSVDAVDANSNKDLDFTGNIALASTGTLSAAQTEVAINGTATFSNIIHTVVGTGLTLTATSAGLNQIVSNTFDITLFVNVAGDFRPKYATTFATNGDWEYYDGAAWVNVPDGNAPQNTSTTIVRILIDQFVNASASASTNYDCDIIVFANGTLEITDNDLPPVAAEFLSANNTLEVQDGGILKIQGDIDLASSTNFILRSGSKMYLDQASITNAHPMWDGVELFEGGSEVEINNWDWSASPSVRSLINITTAINDNANGYKFGKIFINPTSAPLSANWTIVGGPISVNVTENNFEINNTSNYYVAVMSNKTAGISATFGGDIIIHDGEFTFGSSYSSDDFDQTINVNGNFIVNNDDAIYIHKNGANSPTSVIGQVKIGGNIELWGLTSSFQSDVSTKEMIFVGDVNHTIEIAPNCTNIPLIIEAGDTAVLKNENLKFTGNSSIEIENGATFNFGFNGTTALEVQNISGSGNTFLQRGGAYLLITHPQGIWDASVNGNVQDFIASNTTYTQTGSIYHYIGKANQVTGDAITIAADDKKIICELATNALELTCTNSIETTNGLDIRKGIVVNTEANHIFGAGNLIISDGGLKTAVLGSTSVVPMLSGTYTLTGGFVALNAAGDQVLRGAKDYRELQFLNSGTKTISAAISTITGEIIIDDTAILNTEDKTMGGVGTDLSMYNDAQYITAGTGTKPDALGSYILDTNTKIIFNNMTAGLETIRLTPAYANIDVLGSRVGTTDMVTGIDVSGTFTVKNGATFEFINTTGFNGATSTAIDNTNAPTITIEAGSTVNYAGATQTMTAFTPYYANVVISGTGVKTLGAAEIKINEDLTLTSSKILVESNKALTVTDGILNSSEIEVVHGGSIVQINNTNTNTGTNYIIKKTAGHTASTDVTYFSTPTVGTTIDDIVPSTTYRYDFDASIQNWHAVTGSTVMTIGKGYILRNPSTTFADYAVNFNGAINNGLITSPITINGTGATDDDDWNLVGNPYPSVIDADKFFVTNTSSIVNAIYYWKHETPLNGAGNDYVANGYAVWNGTGAVNGGTQYIPSGQGFFVEAKVNGNVTFDNTDRVAGNNSTFYRISDDSNRIWLNLLDNSLSVGTQQLVGLFTEATDNKDNLYDAHLLGSGLTFYSILNSEKFSILANDENYEGEIIFLGYECTHDGQYTITIDHTTGTIADAGNYIYLKDNELNTVQDLTASDYTFTSVSGEFNNRFELFATQTALAINEVYSTNDSLIVLQNQNTFNLSTVENQAIETIIVYDVVGRQLQKVNGAEFNLEINKGSILILNVTLENGIKLSKKVIKM